MTNVEKKVEFKDIPQSVKNALPDSNEYQKFEAARNKLQSQTDILQKNTEDRLAALKNELPPDIRAKVENLSDLVDAVAVEDKNLLEQAGGALSEKAADSLEAVYDQIIGSDDTIKTDKDSFSGLKTAFDTFKEKGFIEGMKEIGSQLKDFFDKIIAIFKGGFGWATFEKIGDLFSGTLDTGKKISDVIKWAKDTIGLSFSEGAPWRDALEDRKLLALPIGKIRAGMSVEDISKELGIKLSNSDAKTFLDKFFKPENFEKIIAEYKNKTNTSTVDEKIVTLKDLVLNLG
ncbi:hypothetical protein BLM37_03995 [Candidatus Gracilibacteria bacterium GN02-873]|jgi:hypothetical protein|nr:hypothetical protein BLM37_03995 [Candidatus Gracilibacteria bacterium GN02-873]